MGLFDRFARRLASERSGQSDALSAHATGISPALLEAALPAEPIPVPEAGARTGRRGRGLVRAEDVLADQLGQKVLGFWLQNRHQVLFPLTVNFRTFEPASADLLARWSAAVLQAGSPSHAERRDELRAWLAGVGADEAVLVAFDEPPIALGALLDRIAAIPGLSGAAYVAALVALGRREVASAFLLQFIAARLMLPSNVVRSADRRFGR